MGFILDLSWEELESFFLSISEKPYRAKQLWQWLFQKDEFSFSRMTNLPLVLRTKLARDFPEQCWPALLSVKESIDGTEKYLWRLHDGELLESVLLHYQTSHSTWVSACISTQVGCPIHCRFCATGLGEFRRNLSAGEELAQILLMEALSGERISRILFMGMGEPFLNWQETQKALLILQHKFGRAVSGRKITLSTVGPAEMRNCFHNLPAVELAFSLHAPDDALRRELISSRVKLLPLRQALTLLTDYAITSSNRVTLEYMLLQEVNDLPQQAATLVSLLRGKPFSLNIFSFNQVESSSYQPSSADRIRDFLLILRHAGIRATIRKPRGADIDAACGQLRGKFLSTRKEEI